MAQTWPGPWVCLIHRMMSGDFSVSIDMAVQNFVGDACRGATWVALHNGGGVGWWDYVRGQVVGWCRSLGDAGAEFLATLSNREWHSFGKEHNSQGLDLLASSETTSEPILAGSRNPLPCIAKSITVKLPWTFQRAGLAACPLSSNSELQPS